MDDTRKEDERVPPVQQPERKPEEAPRPFRRTSFVRDDREDLGEFTDVPRKPLQE